MKTAAICPISDKKINERVARSNATITVLLLGLYLSTSNILIVVFLLLDFLLRSLQLSHYSPIALTSGKLVKLLKLKAKPINAGPKVFAARIGLIFTVLILVATLAGLSTFALSLIVVFGVCAFLEAAIGFCLACEIYPYVYKFTFQSKLDSVI